MKRKKTYSPNVIIGFSRKDIPPKIVTPHQMPERRRCQLRAAVHLCDVIRRVDKANQNQQLGAFTGYFGGLLDEVLMRVNDVVFAFPSILLALVFVSIFGT